MVSFSRCFLATTGKCGVATKNLRLRARCFPKTASLIPKFGKFPPSLPMRKTVYELLADKICFRRQNLIRLFPMTIGITKTRLFWPTICFIEYYYFRFDSRSCCFGLLFNQSAEMNLFNDLSISQLILLRVQLYRIDGFFFI